jgi:hypothetical protein
MKLYYYCSYQIEGSDAGEPAYAVRARTKREVEIALDSEFGRDSYGKITRCEVEYRDGFDLLKQCLQEGGAAWESEARDTREPA